ncbi:MAG: gluconokinase [Burkholderiales bacterium]|nr:gluconokinase [Burkholderiales bacterium]
MSLVVLMGVSGSGKTTVGVLLAQALDCEFHDADDYHSRANVEKMRAGMPLTDDDRWPWLDALNAMLLQRRDSGASVVLACSALRRIYRERLSRGIPEVRFVHLAGSMEIISARLAGRSGHYMPPSLLTSQFATLEPPDDAIHAPIDRPPDLIVSALLPQLRATD